MLLAASAGVATLFLCSARAGFLGVRCGLFLRTLLGSLLALRLDQAQARQVCLRLRRLALQPAAQVSCASKTQREACRSRACCVSFQCRSSARAFSIASLHRAA